jgi:hypothetical protein
MIDSVGEEDDITTGPPGCWFCERQAEALCSCGRTYCGEHTYKGHCLICAFGLGLFETEGETETEPLSGLLMVSLSAAAGDPYIVKPPALQRVRPLPLSSVEKIVAVLVKMLRSNDNETRLRAAAVLAATTNSWPTMNPSKLGDFNHGTSLLCTDQVRRWLLHTLKISRGMNQEPIALAILEKLGTADFRDPYPSIQDNLSTLTCSSVGTRVRDVFDTLAQFYPSRSPLANEHCELTVYEQYTNHTRGAGKSMERIYGPLLKHSQLLAKMLKKGTWISNQARYEEWYYGENEPE